MGLADEERGWKMVSLVKGLSEDFPSVLFVRDLNGSCVPSYLAPSLQPFDGMSADARTQWLVQLDMYVVEHETSGQYSGADMTDSVSSS